MDRQHIQMVAAVSKAVRAFYEAGRPFRVYHGSTNTTRSQASKHRDNIVDVSGLSRVVSVDRAGQTAIVEPNVPMDKLVAQTLKYGLVPPVVMEFPGITVGGGLQGGAGESSSFKWGCFNRTLNWFEVVTADGTIVRASPSDNADLYYASAGAYGSLGVVTAAEIKLIPAKRFVELSYQVVTSFNEALAACDAAKTTGVEYIDGIMLGKDRGVIMSGRMVEVAKGTVRRFRRPQDPWFYLNADRICHEGNDVTEYIPLVDYLFRYDRGAFWTGKFGYDRFGIPFNAVSRFMLHYLMKTRRMYLALEASGLAQEYMVQDLAMPSDSAAEFMNWADSELGIYPLWLCPLTVDTDSPLQSNYLRAKSIMNVGVWGAVKASGDGFIEANRQLEAKVSELGGRKWLYAHAYYSPDEFWRIYDKAWYDGVRVKYHAEKLPTVFDKTHVTKREWVRVSAKRGLWRAMVGRRRPS